MAINNQVYEYQSTSKRGRLISTYVAKRQFIRLRWLPKKNTLRFLLQFFGLYRDQTNKTFLNSTNNDLQPMPAPLALPRASGEASCIII